MTALRQRMEDDMVARGFADRTRESYHFQLTRHTEVGPDSPLDLLARFAPPRQG